MKSRKFVPVLSLLAAFAVMHPAFADDGDAKPKKDDPKPAPVVEAPEDGQGLDLKTAGLIDAIRRFQISRIPASWEVMDGLATPEQHEKYVRDCEEAAEFANRIIDQGAKLDVKDDKDISLTPLTAVLNMSIRDKDGRFRKNGGREAFRLFKHVLEKGASPDFVGIFSPLMLAVRHEDTEVVRLLLDYGASANLADKHSGWTPLMAAADSGNLEIVKLLLDHGASVEPHLTDSTKTAFDFAKSKDDNPYKTDVATAQITKLLEIAQTKELLRNQAGSSVDPVKKANDLIKSPSFGGDSKVEKEEDAPAESAR